MKIFVRNVSMPTGSENLNIKLLSFSLILILQSCAIFSSKLKNLNNSNCESSEFAIIQQKLNDAHRDVLKCFEKNKRVEDFNAYKDLTSKKDISIKCESAKDPQLVSSGKDLKKPLQLNVYTYRLIEKPQQIYEKAMFRESIRWLGYQPFQNVDVPGIAEMCCLDDVAASCQLFRYSKKDWATPAYLKEYSQSLNSVGKIQTGIRTSIEAGVFANRNRQSSDQVRKILFSSLETLNSRGLVKKMSRSEIKNYSPQLGAVAQGIVLASIVDRSPEKSIKNQSSKYLNSLISRFYSNPIDKEKILLFNNIGQDIESVIFKDPAGLQKSWELTKERSEYVCRDLKKTEIFALNELMNDVSYYLFEMKNEIPAGTMYDIATNWSNICK